MENQKKTKEFIKTGKRVVEREARALDLLEKSIEESFSKAENLPSLIQKTKTLYTTLVHQMLMHTMAIAGPMAFLRYFKTLNFIFEIIRVTQLTSLRDVR